VGGLWSDLRFAFRSLARSPGFTAVVVMTLALGIGATTGVFSAMNAILFAGMPYPEPDRLVFGRSTFQGGTVGLSAHDYFDYRDQSTSFESLGAHLEFSTHVSSTGGGTPETLRATYVSTDLFRTLGVVPRLGRTFVPEEGRPAPITAENEPTLLPPVAVISHALWQRRFGASPEAVGSGLTLNGQPVSVVGVLPPGFRFLVDADVWFPLRLNGERATARRFHNWVAVGRLRRGVPISRAQGELAAIAGRLERTYPDSNEGMGVKLTPLADALVANLEPQLLLLAAAVALMLLIACANVANLLLARGVTRRSELAMRTALGASRGRLVRQLLAEGVTFALLGGALGLLVASLLQRLLPFVLGLERSGLADVSLRLDSRVLLFAVVVSLLTGAGVALVPALRSTRVSLAGELKGASRSVTSRGGARLRMALVAIQVALSLVLLVGSSLLLRSFASLSGQPLGFDPRNVLTATLAVPASVSNEEATRFFAGVLDEVQALPGVVAAGMTQRLPIVNPYGSTQVWRPERPDDHSFSLRALGRIVLPGYLGAMRMPLVAGRDLARTDRTGSPPVMVVSQAMARTLFPGESPIGRSVAVDLGGDRPAVFEVVGVVGDARLNRLDEGPDNAMYISYHQFPDRRMNLAIRTAADPEGIARTLRELVWRRNRDVPVEELAALEESIRRSTLSRRRVTGTVTVFSLAALLLAAVGLFGVLAYQVNQREHEIGIRMALGAQRRHIVGTVLRQGLVMTGIGLLAGIAVSLAATRLMARALYAVTPTDPASFAGAACFLLTVALVACLVPVLRALSIQPIRALRYE